MKTPDTMTPEARAKRASVAARARHAKYSPEQRSERARQMALRATSRHTPEALAAMRAKRAANSGPSPQS